jgi:IS30 family transposase
LSLLERQEIERGLRWNRPAAVIAERLGRPTSTVTREIARHGGRRDYCGYRAHRVASEWARRPKLRKLVANPALAEAVEARLERCWSPEQIARRLRKDHPHDPRWWVSHETIYTSLYLQGRGGLRRELLDALRTGRTRRRPSGANPYRNRSHINDKVMISERPAEVDDRAVPGHWEGDLLIGAHSSSQVGTLVERTSRYLMLVHLPQDRRAETVRDAIAHKIRTLPTELTRTLTWDQGKEMAQHRQFRVDTGVQVYFCDPHSPWQRGTVENTNGLLRQYLPKGADLSPLDADDLNRIADELNQRPRKTLDWQTPTEVFNALVATAP